MAITRGYGEGIIHAIRVPPDMDAAIERFAEQHDKPYGQVLKGAVLLAHADFFRQALGKRYDMMILEYIEKKAGDE